jgi:casein kinase II subunit beta
MSLMRDKFDKGTFGTCPRVLCEKQHVLPIGMSEEVRISRVKIYCPRCQEVYVPNIKCNDVDGAFFGCSFAHILLMVLLRLISGLS